MGMTVLERKQGTRILAKLKVAYEGMIFLRNNIGDGIEGKHDEHSWQMDLDEIRKIRFALRLAEDLTRNIQREVFEQNGTFTRKVRPIGAPTEADIEAARPRGSTTMDYDAGPNELRDTAMKKESDDIAGDALNDAYVEIWTGLHEWPREKRIQILLSLSSAASLACIQKQLAGIETAVKSLSDLDSNGKGK